MESVRFFLIDCSDSMFEERPFEDSKLSRQDGLQNL
ncbi:Uncharacterised protein [Capnocytophaga canimorsus]|nr:Uncharacterised protein [Capnocytophaga canimorsus]